MRKTISDRDISQSWVENLSGKESMIAGAGAGLISSVVTCPLDVVKTKLQAQGKVGPGLEGYRGLFGSLSRIWVEEGPRGLYRGLGPTIMGYLPTWAIYFTVYDYMKIRFNRSHRYEDDRWIPHIVSAMTAGATGTVITSPLWVIKTRFMTQNLNPNTESHYTNTLDAFRRMYQTEGLRGFYRGLIPSLLGVVHVAVQFPLYEKFKSIYRPADGTPIPPQTILFCSSVSKVIASVTCYPHEVVRTRLQIQQHLPKPRLRGEGVNLEELGKTLGVTNYSGIVSTIRNITKNDGWRGFYHGLGVNLIRTVPSTALTILSYELIMRHLTEWTHNREWQSST